MTLASLLARKLLLTLCVGALVVVQLGCGGGGGPPKGPAVPKTGPASQSVDFINDGKQETKSTEVILKLAANDDEGVTAYLASEDPATPGESDPRWQPIQATPAYRATVAFSLSPSDTYPVMRSVTVWFQDAAGNISKPATDSILLNPDDRTAPVNTTSNEFINDGEAVTKSTLVMLTLSASDELGVTAYYASESPETPTLLAAGWARVTPTRDFKATKELTLVPGSPPAETRSVHVWFRDGAGNISAPASDSIELVTEDLQPPQSNATDFINHGDVRTESTAVFLSLAARDNVAVAGYLASEEGAAPDAKDVHWKPIIVTPNYREDVPFTLSPGQTGVVEVRSIHVWFHDEAGNISDAVVDSIEFFTKDSRVPENHSRDFIDAGAPRTDSTTVRLTLFATDDIGVAGYFVSESPVDPSADDAGWKPVTPVLSFDTEVDFNLTPSEPGTTVVRTVYVWFKDAAGNVSAPASDSIELETGDSVPPTNTSANFIDGGAASTQSARVTLQLSAQDNVGVTAYFASESQVSPDQVSAWKPIGPARDYSGQVDFDLTAGTPGTVVTRAVHVWFRDAAGNSSERATDSIALETADATAPVNKSHDFINSGSPSTTSTQVTLHLLASDDIAVTAYRASTSNPPSDSGWRDVTPSSSFEGDVGFTLPAAAPGTTEPRTVTVMFKDAAGNISEGHSDSIDLVTPGNGNDEAQLSIFAGESSVQFKSEILKVNNVIVDQSPAHGYPAESGSRTNNARNITRNGLGQVISYVLKTTFTNTGNSYEMTVTDIRYDVVGRAVAFDASLVATVNGTVYRCIANISNVTYNGLGLTTDYQERRCYDGARCHDIAISGIVRDTSGRVTHFTAVVDGKTFSL